MVLLVPDGDSRRVVQIASIAPLIKARAVVVAGEPIEPQLRNSPCHPPAGTFAGELVEWLALTRADLRPAVLQSVGRLVHAGRSLDNRGDAREGGYYRYSALRRWLRKSRLPPPGAWLHLGALGAVLLELQRDGHASIERILRNRSLDASSFRHRVQRLVGLTPTAVRGTIGWEWWVTRFLERNSPP